MSSKCIHVITTHEPQEIVALTKPLFENYAQRIGAELRFISDRKFPNFPPNFERMQVFESGTGFFWNMVVDAGVLLGPLLHDFTKIIDQRRVGLCLQSHAPNLFHVSENNHFIRDGRGLGIVEALIVTSSLTHDLWEPLPGKADDWIAHIKDNNAVLLSEFCLSLNAAKYRFEILNPFASPAQMYRAETHSKPLDVVMKKSTETLQLWGVTA